MACCVYLNLGYRNWATDTVASGLGRFVPPPPTFPTMEFRRRGSLTDGAAAARAGSGGRSDDPVGVASGLEVGLIFVIGMSRR